MKIKKWSSTLILFAITVIAYITASVVFSYTTKPEITKAEFPFSITYEYKGEQKTLSGVYECEFSGSKTVWGEHSRYWDGVAKYSDAENTENSFIIDQSEEITLSVQENMYAGYFMGDPLHKDYYSTYGYDITEPYIQYYDYKNDISLDEENKEEILESIGFKVIDYTYADPIENGFSFSGVRYSGDNIYIFAAIMLAFLLLCLIFVRKDKEYKYSTFDKIGIAINFVMGIIVLPFITIICMLSEIVTNGKDFLSQMTFSVPPFAILCLALSIVLRRKDFSKAGFFVQFGGSVLLVLSLILDTIL